LENFNDINTFNNLKHSNFQDYPSLCIKLFNKVDIDSQKNRILLEIMDEGISVLKISEHSDFQKFTLISFLFQKLELIDIKSDITARYNRLKTEIKHLEEEMSTNNEIIGKRNSSIQNSFSLKRLH